MTSPWLPKSLTAFNDPHERARKLNAQLPCDGRGAVLVTHPAHPPDVEAPMSVGAALDAALVGSTTSFSMLVGYFAHGGVGDTTQYDLHDPVTLLVRELTDPGDRSSEDADATRFRLLFGELRSHDSALALHLWWALCRWRRDAQGAADTWRTRVLYALHSEASYRHHADAGLRDFAGRLLNLADPLCPFAVGSAVDPRPHPCADPASTRSAALLLLFLVQRAADVRCGRDLTEKRRIFHPKLYVVERAADASLGIDVPDSVVIAGSANWSGAALDASTSANVEVATLHRVSGRAFSDPAPGISLGGDLAATARVLFDSAPKFADWCSATTVEDPTVYLVVPPQVWDPPVPQRTPGTATPPPPLDDQIACLAHVIVRNIELALDIGADKLHALRKALQQIDPKIWGNKRPSPYQIDGALRLLVLFQRSRGALLTDEPGLGKTLIAQLVTALLIHGCIKRRWALEASTDKPLAPIRVAILAPARVLGKGSASEEGGTQWHGYATEIRNAVRALLQHDPEHTANRLRWAEDTHLILRPMTNQSLSRKVSAKGPDDKAMPQPKVIDDLQHVSESEVVVLDEAHNFRNGHSTGTRILRFCLAMPTPGERAWHASEKALATPSQEALFDPEPDQPADQDAPGRRILLLTATPFNNRIDDVRTQLGHFAKAFDWHFLPADAALKDAYTRRIAEGGAAFDDAYWQPPVEPAPLPLLTSKKSKPVAPAPTAGDDFQRLVVAASVHFDSSRALDDDDAKLLALLPGDKAAQKMPADKGPRYVWAQRHRQLGAIFATLQRPANADNGAAPKAPLADAELRSRIDAMLVGLVVQRSRRQVLRLLKARDPAEPARMFRAPDQPRVPVPVVSTQDRSGQRDTFEADVLTELIRRVIAGTSSDADEGAPPTTTEPRLTMLAYTLRYERGLAAQSRSDANHRGASNFIGFQAIGLVKRLQSSPYAFVMTLVRGLLRTSLYEVVLAWEVVQRLTGTNTQPGARGPARQLPLDFVDIAESKLIAGVQKRFLELEKALVDYLSGSAGRTLLRLMGINPADFDGASFGRRLWLLAGLGNPDLADGDCTRLQKTLRERLTSLEVGDIDVAVKQLTDAAPARRRAGARRNPGPLLAAQPDQGTAPQSPQLWAGRLLRDLEQSAPLPGSALPARPGLLGDIHLVLDWLVGASDATADTTRLVAHVFHGVTFAHADALATMDALADGLCRSQDALDWLAHTLQHDSRVADLLAWLLAQTLGRTLLAQDTAEVRAACLPAGIKTLVFSEYADTIAYLRAVLTALHTVVVSPPPQGLRANTYKRMMRDLCDRIRDLAAQMHDTLEGLGAPVPAPIDRDYLLAKLSKQDIGLVVEAVKDLYARSAILTSRQATGQRFKTDSPTVTTPADDVTDDDSLGTDDEQPGASESVVSSSALDAFSPWYQIDPRPGGGGKVSPWERLQRAVEQPVHALFATEVLAEGVNLQECGVVVHYDLPWNPTRLIQRNGRVDRRIDPTVEDPIARRDRALSLAGDAQAASARTVADAFWAPQHVYHLTVPPIEPGLDADARSTYARKVREILFAKLSGIREMFGLSAWPIVLEQEEARRVLDGTLAYETPAFRRREELFVVHETLAQHAARNPGALPKGHGALHVPVDAAVMARIHAALAGFEGDDTPSLPTHRLQALALMAWSPQFPYRIPVRSQVEYRPLMHALGAPKSHWPEHFRSLWGRPPEHTGLLSLLGWVGDTSDAADALIAWRDGRETGPDGKSLNVLGATMAELSSGVPGWRDGAFAWQHLAHGIASTGNEVQAPTAAFEAALVVLAQALEAQLSEAPGTASGPHIGPVTLHDAELPPTPACMQPWRALEKFWPELAGRAPGEFYEVTPQPLPPLPATPAFNLLLVPASLTLAP